ncbi:MAG: ribosomal protein S18 acetylase RimI-like enzyme [Halobacteriales archaeon]|jgi:ribosomal protein S18 acetylase RimI-like enzyme
MTDGTLSFPDDVADEFEAPPIGFEDREGREIEFRATGRDDTEAIAEMYDTFDQEDRAQGIPPANPTRVRDWLDTILGEGLNVAAWHGEQVAGHATLMPDDDCAYELAIFVHQDYQGAGIGRRLLEATLGYGQAEGVPAVWLSVERWNRRAVGLYESIGFERHGGERFEQEMAIRLLPESADGDCDAPPERSDF